MLTIRTILYPTDFSERSSHAFELAFALARDYGARLVILHVAPPAEKVFGPAPTEVQEAEYEESLRAKLRWLKVPGSEVPVESVLEMGDPVAVILDRAAEADLIVLGTHGRTGYDRLLMGSVAEEVLRQAPCPVLTIKAPFPGAAREVPEYRETAQAV